MAMLSTAALFLLDVFFPQHCLGCGEEGVLACASCAGKVLLLPFCCFVCGGLSPSRGRAGPGAPCRSCRPKTSVDRFFAAGSYRDDLLRSLIHRLKYGRSTALAGFLADFLYSSLVRHDVSVPPGVLVIPMPLHSRRERLRGFNQSYLIARHLVLRLGGVEIADTVLKRVKPTRPQTALSASLRKINMKGVFAVSEKNSIKGKTVLLIDDVKTTGATIEEAARVLKREGAKRVWAAVVAR